ncbi:MAG TPA: ABC transporter ATP-binding protein, partial [Anaerolineales bacterium]|nr:ABC transporter ATP-binding protein [Anaerolineales bacterium]
LAKAPFWYNTLVAGFIACLAIAAGAWAITTANLVVPDIIRQVIDTGLLLGERAYLTRAALLILGIGLGRALFLFLRRYLTAWLAQRVSFDLRNRLYAHLQRLSFAYHDQTPAGQLISRTIEDVRSMTNFLGGGLIELVQMGLMFVAALAVMYSANTRLAAIATLPLIPLVLVTTNFGQKVTHMFYRIDQGLGEITVRVQENVLGAAVVRAFAREQYEVDRFTESNRELYDARLTVIGQWARIMPTTHFLIALGTILILWFGGQMVLHGEATLGEVVAFNSYFMLLGVPARQLVWLVNSGGEAAAGARRLFEVLDARPAIQSPPNALRLQPIQGRVTFEHVSFRYPGEPHEALKEVHLDIAPNTVVALIGPTGSGKSTLVHLIPRFYDPTEGRVLIDGYDVRTLDLPALRRQVGIVLQTSLLFSTTIRENIAYGRPDATEEEIIAAARAAQVHDFILRLPQGYDTEVGERGVTLSGGQRQRIAIARALLMDPRILILDDATSSVDTETEHLIQQALFRLMEGRTTFIIAQRLATVKRADLILVLDQGRIVQMGTHETLLAQPGLYREIYELQLRSQEEGEAEPTPGD